MKHRINVGLWAVIGGLMFFAAPAAAQEAPGGDAEFVNANPVWENTRGGAISARRPGRMVQAGTQRFRLAHADSINRSRNGPEITEIAPPVDEDSALRAELITGFFDSVNSTLQVISAAIGAGLGVGDDGGSGDGATGPDLSDLLGTITGSGE